MASDPEAQPAPVAAAAAHARPAGLVLMVIGVAQALAWPLAMASSDGDGLASRPLATAAYALACGGLLLAVSAVWRARPAARVASLACGCLALILGGLATQPAYGASFAHPALAPAIGIGIASGLLWPRRRLPGALAALALAYLAGIIRTLALGTPALSAWLSNGAVLVGAGVLTHVVAGGWLLAESRAARADARATQAESLEHALLAATQADQAREDERARQYRTVHDTVLSSLSALARGSVDTTEPAVRQRLSAEADYLRGLIASTRSRSGMYLVGEIARTTREYAASGLRVHPHIADVPDDLPEEVERALGECVREALTNVVRHSGTRQAWVTVVGSTRENPLVGDHDVQVGPAGPRDTARRHSHLGSRDSRTHPEVQVTITDRGAGFDPAARRRGLGIDRSLIERMRDVGGSAAVDSAPGQGTSVELRWPV